MFTKFIHAVETWLRAIISSELSNVPRDKQELHAHLMTFNAQVATFKESVNALNTTVQHLNEVRENNTLREHVKELHTQLAVISDSFNKRHPRILT